MEVSRGHCSAAGEAPHTGTTIVACSYPGGVVLGCDGRVSTGTYISNRASNKLAALSEKVYLLRSGSAPDAQAVTDYVSFFVAQLTAELGKPPSVRTVAKLVQTMNYQNKDNLVGALVIGGYDEERGGQVFGCPIGGTLVKEAWAIDGSGSTFIWGFCDAEYRDDFTRAQAEAFVAEAVALAMNRDSSSGGCIRLVACDALGEHHTTIQGDQVSVYQEELGLRPAGLMGGLLR
ncbi:MAG: hypothetical protein WDW36_003482 [Sanguina aurantia]